MSKPILWISSTFYHVKILYQPHNNLLKIGRLQPSMLQPATFLRKSPLQPTITQIINFAHCCCINFNFDLGIVVKKVVCFVLVARFFPFCETKLLLSLVQNHCPISHICYTVNQSHFDAKNSILVLKIIHLKSR